MDLSIDMSAPVPVWLVLWSLEQPCPHHRGHAEAPQPGLRGGGRQRAAEGRIPKGDERLHLPGHRPAGQSHIDLCSLFIICYIVTQPCLAPSLFADMPCCLFCHS